MAETTTASPSSSSLHGSGLLVIWGSINQQVDEAALNDWWTNEHLPERLAISGFNHCRRYFAVDSSGKSMYQVWYEVDSVATLASPQYMAALNDPTPRTAKFMPLMATLSRSACQVLYSAIRPDFARLKTGGLGSTMAHIVFDLPADQSIARALLKTLENNLELQLSGQATVLATHIIQHDEQATHAGSTSKSYEAVDFSAARGSPHEKAMILIEFAALPNAPWLKHEQITKSVEGKLEGQGVHYNSQMYQLICAMGQ